MTQTSDPAINQPPQQPAPETPEEKPFEVVIRKPGDNPVLNWRVELHEGGAKSKLCEGTEDECYTCFEKQKESLSAGTVALFAPGNNMPLEQIARPSFRPRVAVPDDYAGGEKAPIIKIERPDLAKLEGFIPLDQSPIEETNRPAPPIPAAPAPQPTPLPAQERVHISRQFATPVGTALPVGLPPIYKDLHLVDAAIADSELLIRVLQQHRAKLLEEVSRPENAQEIIEKAVQSIQKLR